MTDYRIGLFGLTDLDIPGISKYVPGESVIITLQAKVTTVTQKADGTEYADLGIEAARIEDAKKGDKGGKMMKRALHKVQGQDILGETDKPKARTGILGPGIA